MTSIADGGLVVAGAPPDLPIPRTTPESTHLVLESRSEGYSATFVTQGPADRTPIEPTLEMSGCGSWESC